MNYSWLLELATLVEGPLEGTFFISNDNSISGVLVPHQGKYTLHRKGKKPVNFTSYDEALFTARELLK